MNIVRGKILPKGEIRGALRLESRLAEGTAAPSPAKLPNIVTRERMRALAERDDLLARAKEQAAALLEEATLRAKAEVDALREDARQEEASRFARAYLELRKREEGQAESLEKHAIELGVLLAERMIRRKVEEDPALLLEMAQEAWKQARGARSVVVEARPEESASLERALTAFGFGEGAVRVEANKSLRTGDLVLRTDLGTIDARLSTQLERLQRALRK